MIQKFTCYAVTVRVGAAFEFGTLINLLGGIRGV